MRDLTRRGICGTIVLLALGTSPAAVGARVDAGSASSAETFTLARVNVIEGTSSGFVDVHLPRKATFDLTLRPRREEGPSRGLSVEGAGRAVGIALTSPPPVYGTIFGTPRFLIGGRFGECSEPGCDPGGDVVNFQLPSVYPNGDERRRQTLLPGDYRLHLIADGAPVRVKLVLEGLRGRTRLTPTAPAPVDLKTPTVHASHLGGPSFYSAGDTFEGGGRGVAVTLLALRGPFDNPAYSSYGMCGFYRDEVDVPDPIAYGPNCHARPGESAVGTWNDTERFSVVFYQGYSDVGFPRTDHTRGQGVWFESHNPIDRATSHIFTLVLD